MDDMRGQAFGDFEFDNMVACLMAMDAAAKAAEIRVEGVERNRLTAGACVKIRGSVSDVRAAMEAALREGAKYGSLTGHNVIAAPTEDTEEAILATLNK